MLGNGEQEINLEEGWSAEVTESERLDKYLAAQFSFGSRSKWVRLIEDGKVTVNGKAEKASFKLTSGDLVEISEFLDEEVHDLTPVPMDLDIRFEDDYLLVVNKPRGLATHPALTLKEPTLVHGLLARSGQLSQVGESYRPGIVHRLDKETTGLMVVAKTDQAHTALAKQMETKTAERRYLAVTGGWPEQDLFRIDAPIGRDPVNRQKMAVQVRGKSAQTYVLRLARLEVGVLLGCRLTTGRTHQIRVHLSSVGLPVYGDTVYAPSAYRSGPLQLHAAYLAFDHPMTGERVEFTAEPPEDFLGRGRAEIERLATDFRI